MNTEFIRPVSVGFPIGTPKTSPEANTSGVPFKDLFGSLISDLYTTADVSSADTAELVMGTNADLHTIMINSAMETTAIETVVEITSRAVSAYKEIMQMQI